MKSINFQKVGARNFCCYKDYIEYNFDNDKVILITGPNGSGKSTIFDIIPFSFWGITTKELKSEDVVNNEVGKNCHTYVDFSIGEDQYRVDRYVKDSKLSNTVTLTKNGEVIKRGHREVSEEIDYIVMPQKLFMNTLLFGQKVKTFFTDLSDAAQKDIFRKVLQLDEYEIYYKRAAEKLKEVEGEYSRNDVQIEINEKMIVELQDQYNQLLEVKAGFEKAKKENLENFEVLINTLLSKKFELTKEITQPTKENPEELIVHVREYLTKLRSEKDSIEKEQLTKINDINQKSKIKEAELKSKAEAGKTEQQRIYSEALAKVKDSNNKQESEIQKLYSDISTKLKLQQTEISRKESELKKLQDDINIIKDSLNRDIAICPLCKQEVGKSNISHLQIELKTKELSCAEIKNQLVSDSEIIRKLLEEKESLDSKLRTFRLTFTKELEQLEKSHNDKISAINKRISDVLKQLQEIVSRDIEKVKFESSQTLVGLGKNINTYIETEQKLIEEINKNKQIKEEINNIETKLSTTRALKVDLEGKSYDETGLKNTLQSQDTYREKIKSLIDKKDQLSKKIKVLEFWKSGFSMSGIPNMLIDEAIPFMNKRVMFYLDKIGGRYIVSFDTMSTIKSGEFRDKISVNVLDTKTKANLRKQLSGGQTRVVDIATILTLRDLQSNIQGVSTNIIMLDEIFDSLDDQNISYVSGLIRQLAKGQSTHIISHRQIDQIDADEVFTTFD